MRQLSYHFQRKRTKVVAGGSICTLFPEFASQFFDAVCAGGVDSVSQVIQDFESGALKPIYRSASDQISQYDLDYGLFARAGISPPFHLIEASRGCSFRCAFCVLPAEDARHAPYDIEAIRGTIDNAIKNAPVLSFRRVYPTVFFLDNNFTDDLGHALAIAELLKKDDRIRSWGALVTQNVLHDRDLIRRLFDAKCRMLFVGLESLDREFLRRYNKKQNLSRRGDILADIRFAESLGICVGYGYLFDPRTTSAAEMQAQIEALAAMPGFPMPTFLSLVSPLVGSAAFWDDARNGDLAANLLLRDLDGETVAFSRLKDSKDTLSRFAETMSLRPWKLVSRRSVIRSMVQRLRATKRFDPIRWYIIVSGSLYPYAFRRQAASPRRSYFAGEDPLDPQYEDYPPDITQADWVKYFKPIAITGADGQLADWLSPYQERQLEDVLMKRPK